MIQDLPEFLQNPDPNIFMSDNFLVLDMENAHYGTGFPDAQNKDADIVLTCYWHGGQMRHKWGDEFTLGKLIDKINSVDFIVAHNTKHELGWLARAGLDLTTILAYDTMIGEYCIAGNRKWQLDLGNVAKSYGFPGKDPLVDKLIGGEVCPSEIPKKWLLSRCVYDVDTTRQIFLKQRQYLKDKGLLNVFFSRCIFTPVLTDIESQGVCLDKEVVLDTYEKALERRQDIETVLNTYSEGVKWSSPAKVADYMYDTLKFEELKDARGNPIRTATGRRSAKKENILKLKVKNKNQKKFIETYSDLSVASAELSKSLDFFYGVVTEGTGIFNARFNQCITITHRLSSTGKKTKFECFPKGKSVQLQNLKREFKPIMTARYDGWFVAESDGAGMEFRAAADLAKDKLAIAAIRDHEDVHALTASIVYADEWRAAQGNKAAMKAIRQDSKEFTFKPLYGGTSGTDAQKSYYARFAEKYPEIKSMQDAWVDEAMTTKELRLITGLVAYFPHCEMKRSGYVNDNTKVRNLPVQQFATADVIPVAITYKWHRMKANKMESFMVNTVHDSDITELHPEEVDLHNEITKQAYLSDVYFYMDRVYNYRFSLPMGVEIKAGTHWGEENGIKEILFESEPQYETAA